MRLLILLYPWLELLSLIQLGIETSAFTALLWVMGAIFVGITMIKKVGNNSLVRLREAQQSGVLQQHLLVDDMAVAVSGLLLIIPGLVSDVFALIILIGPLRRLLGRVLFGASATTTGAFGGAYSTPDDQPRGPATLEGEFRELDSGSDAHGEDRDNKQ